MEVSCPVAPADDWVVRTAGEVRAEARTPASRRGADVRVGDQPVRARAPGQPARADDAAPRRGRDPQAGGARRHILSWDDYDRLRRVPAGFPESFAEHIGRPLTAVPDPCGQHQNWAEHFKEPLRESLARLGVRVTEISQTQMYTSGAYTEQIIIAMRRRADIGAVLARYQTKRSQPSRRRRPAERGHQGLLPVQAVLRGLRARRHHGHRLRRRDHRDHLHLRLRRPGGPGADRRGGREAGLEGRLADALGLRAGDVRAGRGRPLLARIQLHRRRGAGVGDLRRRDAAALRVRLRRHHRRLVEDERLGRPARPPRPTRWRSSRRRCSAGCTPGAVPSSPSPWPSTRRWAGSTTSGTR